MVTLRQIMSARNEFIFLGVLKIVRNMLLYQVKVMLPLLSFIFQHNGINIPWQSCAYFWPPSGREFLIRVVCTEFSAGKYEVCPSKFQDLQLANTASVYWQLWCHFLLIGKQGTWNCGCWHGACFWAVLSLYKATMFWGLSVKQGSNLCWTLWYSLQCFFLWANSRK